MGKQASATLGAQRKAAWRNRLSRCAASKQTVEALSRREAVPVGTVDGWRARLRARDVPSPTFANLGLCCRSAEPKLGVNVGFLLILGREDATSKNMYIFEREVNWHRYRIAAQSVWGAERGRSVSRQVVLGPAEPPRVADLSATQTVGTRGVGDVGALIWTA